MSLPREVTECIIDVVAEDRQTLRTIAQVARVFVSRAHHHLFSDIHLNLPFRSGLDSTVDILQAFLQVLRDGLHFPGIGIVNHLRHFHLKDLLGFTNHAAEIFRLLSDINRLESLTLNLHLSFLSLTEECRASLTDLCRSQNLSSLSIYGLFDIPKSLFHRSHVKQIHLFYFKCLSYPPDQPKFVYRPESIDTISSQFPLVLDAFHAGGGEIESSTLCREALACLKKLDITVCSVLDIPFCLDAASFAGDSFKQLNLHVTFSKSSKATPACPFDSLSNLRILQINFHQGYLTPVDCVFYLGQLVQLWTLPASLEKLCLSLTTCPVIVRGDDVPSGELDSVDWYSLDWHSLDRILTSPSFCAVPSITFAFHRLFKFRLPAWNAKDDGDMRGSEFIPEDKMPVFTASRPGNFVVDVQVV